jgi:hypothetical protein
MRGPSVNEKPSLRDGGAISPLLTKRDFCTLLSLSERKFEQLRAAGIVGAPLELSPRVARWTQADYDETVRRLPRREGAPEPARLAEGRRARIERMKGGQP